MYTDYGNDSLLVSSFTRMYTEFGKSIYTKLCVHKKDEINNQCLSNSVMSTEFGNNAAVF